MKLSLKITNSPQFNRPHQISYSLSSRLNTWNKNRLVRNTNGKSFKTPIFSYERALLTSPRSTSSLFTTQLNIYRSHSRSNYSSTKPPVTKVLIPCLQLFDPKNYFFVSLFSCYLNWTNNTSILQFSVLTLLRLNSTKLKPRLRDTKRRALGQVSAIIPHRVHLL